MPSSEAGQFLPIPPPPAGYKEIAGDQVVPLDCLIWTFPCNVGIWCPQPYQFKWQPPDAYDISHRVGKKWSAVQNGLSEMKYYGRLAVAVPIQDWKELPANSKPYVPSPWAEPLPLP